jgi:ribosomal protein S18 acetylase RimI-like enzyme
MISIRRATTEDYKLLSEIGIRSVTESHGHSAPAADFNAFIQAHFTEEAFRAELENPEHIYHIILYDGIPAGYSKIILNKGHPDMQEENVTKLERLYLLKEFYGLQLGAELINYNIRFSKEHHQAGMWLYVWVENHRAFAFYKKQGFQIIGHHDYEISPTHSNPNYRMYLKY